MIAVVQNSLNELIILQLIATTAMFGIVLFVHAVQYPMLNKVPVGVREEFEREYVSRTGLVIMPLMLIEAVAATLILLIDPIQELARSGAVVLAAIWLITFFISVPCHSRLSREWSTTTHRILMWSNLARCIGWGTRVVIALQMLISQAPC